MKNRSRLTVAANLLSLERGQDELLLTNTIDHRPLYINRGREYIKAFLKAVRELGSYDGIVKAYPEEVSLLNVLLDYRIVVPHGAEKPRKIIEPAPGRSDSGKRMQMSLYLLLSQSCNMRCVYCLDGARTYQTDKNLRMSKEVAFRSIERCLDDIDERGRLEVIFFGGEPLLNWPLAKEVIIHCEKCLTEQHKGKQRQYHFTSNLSFLPNDFIEWAKKYEISFLCDIDGPPEIHNRCRPFQSGGGTYESTVRNIRLISEAGLRIDLRATITALNHDYLLDIAEQHKTIGGKSSAFCPVNPVNSDESVLPEKLLPSPEKVIKGMTDVYRSKLWKAGELYPFNLYATRFMPGSCTILGCGAPYGNVPVVDVNGDVYPCIYLVGIKRFYLGNIMDETYPKTDVLEQMRNGLHVDHREDCKECSWRYMCGGGCPLGQLTVLNNDMATTEVKTYSRKIYCANTKNILETLLWEKAQEAVTPHVEDPVHAPKCL